MCDPRQERKVYLAIRYKSNENSALVVVLFY